VYLYSDNQRWLETVQLLSRLRGGFDEFDWQVDPDVADYLAADDYSDSELGASYAVEEEHSDANVDEHELDVVAGMEMSGGVELPAADVDTAAQGSYPESIPEIPESTPLVT
jgi:hypothetical protein